MPDERIEVYAYLATLLSRLYPYSRVIDPGQRRERAVDYCEVYDSWRTMNPANNPDITVGLLQTIGASIRAKAQKWGVRIDFGPATGPVVPNVCIADSLPGTSSILDKLLNTTSEMGKLIPILLVVVILGQVGGMLSGGSRR